MRKLFAVAVASALAVSLGACGGGAAEQDAGTDAEQAVEEVPVEGGWAVNDEVAGTTLTAEQRELFDKALAELVGVDYEPVCVLGQQVVAGMNYAYLCRATVVVPDAQPAWTVVVIYTDLDGNATFTCANEIGLADPVLLSGDAGEMVGAWEVAEATESAALPGDADAAFAAATEGSALKAQALLGTQVVAGTNYKVLCLGSETEGGPQQVSVATIYQDLDGNAELTALDALDLAAYTVEAEPADAQ